MTNDKLLKHLTNTAIPTAAPIEITDVQDISAWQHQTTTFTGVWSAGKRSQKLILRQYTGRITHWQTQDPYQADRVWAVMRRLRLDGFPAPRPVARGLFGETPYLIWRQPRGETWNPEEFDAQTKALVPQLARLLARLHALNHNGLNNEPLYQATVAGTLVRMLIWSREMQNEDLRQMIKRLKPAVARIKSWPHCLLHGDPLMSNILILDKKIAALLNWENAAIGDPRWDVMTAAHHLHQFNPAQAAKLINRYEKISRRRIANRSFWYAMIAVRLYALKSWVAHALEAGSLSPRHAEWTQDLAAVQESAFEYLDKAGL
jgi:aminoglycoside phosphotransferase (APT) family kinase protein